MSDLRLKVRQALHDHLPARKDYSTDRKFCRCGHSTPMGDLHARTRHLEDVVVAALADSLPEEKKGSE